MGDGCRALFVVIGAEQLHELVEHGLLITAVDDNGDLVTVVDPLRDDGEDARRVDGCATGLLDRDRSPRGGSGLGEELGRPRVQAVSTTA